MKHRTIIQKLRNLNLNSYPYSEVRNLLSQFGKFGVIITNLHQDKIIIRARMNFSNKERFNYISELSYKPQNLNTTYQRASTPNNTMFYGSILPAYRNIDEPSSARITVLFELDNFFLSNFTSGKRKITFSSWLVNEDISLISLIQCSNFKKPTKLALDLQEKFYDLITTDANSLAYYEISKYLASEFAKQPIMNNFDYLISAIYSEMIIDKGFDGVLYPSVKLDGNGINIAIKPETVENKMNFLAATESTIIKNGKNIFIQDDTDAVLTDKYGILQYKDKHNIY